jgi:hypothetical protein
VKAHKRGKRFLMDVWCIFIDMIVKNKKIPPPEWVEGKGTQTPLKGSEN